MTFQRTRSPIVARALIVALLATSFGPVAPASAQTLRGVQVRITPTDPMPDNSIYQEQPFRIEATAPQGANNPDTLDVTLRTADGVERRVTLKKAGDGTYASDEITVGGVGGVFTGPLERYGSQQLASSVGNGEAMTVRYGDTTGNSVIVYRDEVQQGIAQLKMAIDKAADQLVRENKALQALERNPGVAKNPKAVERLRRLREQMDWKMRMLQRARQSLGMSQPIEALLYGQEFLKLLYADPGDPSDPMRFGDQRAERNATQLADDAREQRRRFAWRQIAMGLYVVVTRMTLAAQVYILLPSIDPVTGEWTMRGTTETGAPVTWKDRQEAIKEITEAFIFIKGVGTFVDALVEGGTGEITVGGTGAKPNGGVPVGPRPGSPRGGRPTGPRPGGPGGGARPGEAGGGGPIEPPKIGGAGGPDPTPTPGGRGRGSSDKTTAPKEPPKAEPTVVKNGGEPDSPEFRDAKEQAKLAGVSEEKIQAIVEKTKQETGAALDKKNKAKTGMDLVRAHDEHERAVDAGVESLRQASREAFEENHPGSRVVIGQESIEIESIRAKARLQLAGKDQTWTPEEAARIEELANDSDWTETLWVEHEDDPGFRTVGNKEDAANLVAVDKLRREGKLKIKPDEPPRRKSGDDGAPTGLPRTKTLPPGPKNGQEGTTILEGPLPGPGTEKLGREPTEKYGPGDRPRTEKYGPGDGPRTDRYGPGDGPRKTPTGPERQGPGETQKLQPEEIEKAGPGHTQKLSPKELEKLGKPPLTGEKRPTASGKTYLDDPDEASFDDILNAVKKDYPDAPQKTPTGGTSTSGSGGTVTPPKTPAGPGTGPAPTGTGKVPPPPTGNNQIPPLPKGDDRIPPPSGEDSGHTGRRPTDSNAAAAAAGSTTASTTGGGATASGGVPSLEFEIYGLDEETTTITARAGAETGYVFGGFRITDDDGTGDPIGLDSGPIDPFPQLIMIEGVHAALGAAPALGNATRPQPITPGRIFGGLLAWLRPATSGTAAMRSQSIRLDRRRLAPGTVVRLENNRSAGGSSSARVVMSLVATGASTGEVFTLRAINGTAKDLKLNGSEGLVLQAIKRGAVRPAVNALSGPIQTQPILGYCLQFANTPPSAGTLYQIADRALQEKFKPMRQVMQVARRLSDAGLLHPDTDPDEYLTFVKQWALWTKIEKWDIKSFERMFLEHTKKNVHVLDAKLKWTKEVEQTIRATVPTRWRDIAAVLEQVSGVDLPGAAASR